MKLCLCGTYGLQMSGSSYGPATKMFSIAFVSINFRLCTTRLDVVCGTDGVTYSNHCNLKAVACQTGDPNLKLASQGKCPNCSPIVEAVEAEPEGKHFKFEQKKFKFGRAPP